jgi:hypothetical protein
MWRYACCCCLAGAVSTALLAGPEAHAQTSRAWLLEAHGGAFHSFTAFNPNATYKTKLGFNVGGAVGLQLGDYAVFYLEGIHNRSELQFQGVGTDTSMAKTFVIGSVQGQIPMESGLKVYVRAGGGVLHYDQDGYGDSRLFPVFKGGAGASYPVQNNLAIFVENMHYIYELYRIVGVRTNERRIQFDTSVNLGVSYTLSRR